MDVGDDDRKTSGCGLFILYNSVFRRRDPYPGRQSSASAGQSPNLSPSNSKRRRSTSDVTNIQLGPAAGAKEFMGVARAAHPHRHYQGAGVVAPNSQYKFAGAAAGKQQPYNSTATATGPAVPSPAWGRTNSITTELDNMIHDHQRSKGSSALLRASSGNVMVFGNLGNIRAPGAVTSNIGNATDRLPKTTTKELNSGKSDGSYHNNNRNSNGGSSSSNHNNGAVEVETPEVLCRALSRRLDPEELKEMGNEEYKMGRFAEAVALYDRAILIDPEKAPYWSNKAAALMAMGQLLEAVMDCKEAVRLDPSYGRAHQRLATLYLRLGEAEKAFHHYKLAPKEASAADILQAKSLQVHLSKIHEARKLRDWHTVLKEAQSAVSTGADSSPQVLAAKSEALLALQRHEEAETTMGILVKFFDVDTSLKFFGVPTVAYMFAVQAQVLIAAGRFEDAVGLAQRAAQIDPSSKEVTAVARKSRAVAHARATGNDLFRASKYREACMGYEEGLHQDPHNAIILCNRAACRAKLGQLDKAIEDCNSALVMRPSYNKARLRRADCNAKLGRWEASIQDYEALARQMPEDEEVSKALAEAQMHLNKQRNEDIKDIENAANLVHITTENQFNELIMSDGPSVSLFYNKLDEDTREKITFMKKLCKQHSNIKFMEVDLGAIRFSEEFVRFAPMFKIYKNGSLMKDIRGSDHEQLENFLKAGRC